MRGNRWRVSILSLCLVLLTGLSVACAANPGENKGECVLTNQNVEDIFKTFNEKDVKILGIEPSSIAGLMQVGVEVRGREVVVYIDCSKRYMLQGFIIDMNTKTNVTDAKLQEYKDRKRIDVSKIPLDGALVMGDPKAPKKVIVFTDPD